MSLEVSYLPSMSAEPSRVPGHTSDPRPRRKLDPPAVRGHLSKLGAIFNKANSHPRITARRGGRAIKKILRSFRFLRGQGGVPIERTRNTTPAASIRRLRAIFLVTPPPLLAVMRGGEFAFFEMTSLNHRFEFLQVFSSESHLPSVFC